MKSSHHKVILLAVMILQVVLTQESHGAEALSIKSEKEINNFDTVSETLWRGAMPSAAAIESLHKSGVRSVIDLTLHKAGPNNESKLVKSLGMNYFHLPMGYLSPNMTTIFAFLDIVCNPQYQPVFVHCRQGADRTGTLVGIYRLLVQGWSWNETYKDMRTHNFKPWLVSLRKSVFAFQHGLYGPAKFTNPLTTLRRTMQSVIDSEHERLLASGFKQLSF